MYKLIICVVCFITVSLFTINSGFSQMPGLVGAWLFDEGSGVKAMDSSGNKHNGELIGSAGWSENGVFGSALSCDGTEGYVMVPDHTDFEFEGDFTLACWFQNSTPPSDHSGLITKGYDKAGGAGGNMKPWYLVYFLTSGTVDLYLRTVNDVNSRASGKTIVNDGDWHYVVAMKDGNEVKVYIDGKEDGKSSAVDAKYGDNNEALVFMVHHTRWIKGLMDEVAIFNRAISEDEIESIMTQGLGLSILAVQPQGKIASTWGYLKLQ